jgi:hypothetical protein
MTNLQILNKIKQITKYEDNYTISCKIYESYEDTIDNKAEYIVEIVIQFENNDTNSNNVYRTEFETISLEYNQNLKEVKKQLKKVSNYLKKYIDDIIIDDMPYTI